MTEYALALHASYHAKRREATVCVCVCVLIAPFPKFAVCATIWPLTSDATGPLLAHREWCLQLSYCIASRLGSQPDAFSNYLWSLLARTDKHAHTCAHTKTHTHAQTHIHHIVPAQNKIQGHCTFHVTHWKRLMYSVHFIQLCTLFPH